MKQLISIVEQYFIEVDIKCQRTFDKITLLVHNIMTTVKFFKVIHVLTKVNSFENVIKSATLDLGLY